MKAAAFLAGLALAVCGSPATAREASHATASIRETVRPASRERLPNGQELVALEVTFPPGAASVPHTHPSFVYAYVLSGSIVSAVGDEKPRTFRAGESWHEPAGALHRVTRNASATAPAKLLAIFIGNAGETGLVRPVLQDR